MTDPDDRLPRDGDEAREVRDPSESRVVVPRSRSVDDAEAGQWSLARALPPPPAAWKVPDSPPSGRAPAIDAPETTGPDATGPDATGPDVTGPDVTGPDAPARDASDEHTPAADAVERVPSRARRAPGALVGGLVGGLVGALVVTGAYVALDDDPSPVASPSTSQVIARPSNEVTRAGNIADILAKGVPAVVAIVADGGPTFGGGAGTGFVISDDGVVVTNNHVVEGASDIEARFSDGTSMRATVLGTDAGSDLAVLDVEGSGLPTLELGDSDAVQVGDDVVAIGNALALEGGLSVTRGIVSGLDRTVPTSRNSVLAGLIQTDAAINPGNSGGPLVDSRGRVIAINTAIADPSSAQNVGFAIPISQAEPIIEALRSGNQPAYLGVTIDTDSDAEGAVVRTVAPGSPADRAGMRGGDLIVSIDGRAIGSWERLRPAIRANQVGETVDVVVERDGEQVTLHVTLEEDPGSN